MHIRAGVKRTGRETELAQVFAFSLEPPEEDESDALLDDDDFGLSDDGVFVSEEPLSEDELDDSDFVLEDELELELRLSVL